jgi:hypothetical protein
VFGGSGCFLVLQVDGVCAHHIGPAASHGEVGLASLGFGGQVGRRWPGLRWRQGAVELARSRDGMASATSHERVARRTLAHGECGLAGL